MSSLFNEGSLVYFKKIENFQKWSFLDASKFAFICNYVVKRQTGTRVFTCDILHVLHQIFRTMKGNLVVYLENQIIQIKKYCWCFTSMQVSSPHRSLPNSVSRAAKFSVQSRRYFSRLNGNKHDSGRRPLVVV